MREPTFLECLFVYERDVYGQPKYRTNKLNWRGIKYLLKKCRIKIKQIINYLFQYIVPIIIGYLLGQGV